MPYRRPLPKRMILVYLFWWVQWALMQVLVIHHYGFNWLISASDSMVSNSILFGLVFTTNNVMRFYQPSNRTWYIGLIWNICIAFASVFAFNWIQTYLFLDENDYIDFLGKSMPVRFCSEMLMVTCSSMISWIWSQLIELRESEQRKATLEQMAKESELVKIRQQLQPHFLFNSLNSISALIVSKPEQARTMIQQLSDFLRGTLRKDDQQLVSLDDELLHLQLYLDIEKVRFGHRLNFEMKVDESAGKKHLPVLLLQPIVENAIKFGLYDTLGETRIVLEAHGDAHYLYITIRNPFDPESAKPRRGTGYGLSSVERRLSLLYSRNDLLSVKPDAGVFSTLVKIPQQA